MESAALEAISKPTLNFPADLNTNISPTFEHADATVNGVPSKAGANVPTEDRVSDYRYQCLFSAAPSIRQRLHLYRML